MKLDSMGLSNTTLTWVFSYLTNRTQCIVDELSKMYSAWSNVDVEVRHGSVFGPLLFRLYINDISKNLKYYRQIIFADDTQICMDATPAMLVTALTNVTHDVNEIVKFSRDNDLKLNATKSKIIILGSSTYIISINFYSLPQILVDGTIIPYVHHTKNLGIVMQSNLSRSKHVSYIFERVHHTSHRLKLHRNSLTTSLHVKSVKTLVFSLTDYYCVVHNDCTAEVNTKLQRLINSSIRFIYDLKRDDHITPHRLRLKWLSVKNRRVYFISIQLYNILNDNAPNHVQELFMKKSETAKQMNS